MAFTTAIVPWYAAGPTRSMSVISNVAPATSSQMTLQATVCRNARKMTASAAVPASNCQKCSGANNARAGAAAKKPLPATVNHGTVVG